MQEVCPLCGTPLINGSDGKQKIEYTEENRALYENGQITLDELNETAKIYYMRKRLCPNLGNQNTYQDETGTHLINPPCQNYYGIRGGTIQNPDVFVEEIKIYDN